MFEAGQEISLEGDRGATRVTVRGWKEGVYLLVDIPSKGWNVRDASPLVGRIFHEGSYHGFTTHSLGGFMEIGLMVLQYPEDTIETEYRMSERFSVTAPVTIYRTTAEKTVEWDGIITDISKDGCQLMSHKSIPVDTTVFLRGAFTDSSTFETIGVFIKSSEIVGGQYRYGGRFEISSDSDMDALAAYIDKMKGFRETDIVVKQQSSAPEIPVGARCQIQVGKTRYTSTLRGSNFPKFIIMDIPFDNNKPVIVHHHAEGVVRFESGGVISGFEAQVTKQYTSPFAIWVTSYPEEIQSVNLRKSQRITTFLLSKLVSPDKREMEGAIVDLSEGGGLFVTGSNSVKEGARHLLEVTLPSGETIQELSCVAKSVKQKGEKTLVGLLFNVETNEKYSKLLSFYLSCAQRLF